MVMPNRQIVNGEPYRYGYQGEFAETDPETGKPAFQLRLYDPRLNRWLAPDPMGQYHSPYMAMDNRWNMSVDPTGGCTTCPDNANKGDTFQHSDYGTLTSNGSGEWFDSSGGVIGNDIVLTSQTFVNDQGFYATTFDESLLFGFGARNQVSGIPNDVDRYKVLELSNKGLVHKNAGGWFGKKPYSHAAESFYTEVLDNAVPGGKAGKSAVSVVLRAQTKKTIKKQVEKNLQKVQNRVTNVTKQSSSVWKKFQSAGNGRKTTGTGKDKKYYEWDHTHNDIEVYDRRGNHLGSMNPSTGEMYKSAVSGRTIKF